MEKTSKSPYKWKCSHASCGSLAMCYASAGEWTCFEHRRHTFVPISTTIECAICLTECDTTEMSKMNLFMTSCGHCFHTACIQPWVEDKENQSCPMCRQNIKANYKQHLNVRRGVDLMIKDGRIDGSMANRIRSVMSCRAMR